MTRLPSAPTEKIDRSKTVAFKWQGIPMNGLKGDSVASALFANGVRIVSRSLKYHRPRGLYSLDGESGNTMVNIEGECNVRAENTPLREGMNVLPQNTLGRVENDLFGILDRFDGFMPAGFYYRKFHKPPFIWPLALKGIRRMAGTGKVDLAKEYDSDRYEEIYLNGEIAVLGGGPAGLSAALAAADQGLRVVLFEARPELGGFYDWRTREYAPGQPLFERAGELVEKVKARDNIRLFTHTFVNNLAGDNIVTGFQVGNDDDSFEQRYLQLRPKAVVVATGCIERPLIFENNERPGVMQANCALRLAQTYGLLPGSAAVFSVGDDLGLESAVDLANRGLKVLAVADARKDGHDPALVTALKSKEIPFLPGWAASEARGGKTVDGAVLGNLDSNETRRFACDLLVASAGLTPVTGSLSTAQAKFAFDQHTGFFLPSQLPPRIHAGGRLLGYIEPAAIEASGALAGLRAAKDAGVDVAMDDAEATLSNLPGPAKGCSVVHGPGIGMGRKSFVCFDEDGTYKLAKQSVEQGFDVSELAKRFGVFGLGPSQGGIPGHNLPLVLAELRGDGMDGLFSTTVRSPLVPTLIATLAGPNHDIFKRTPMNDVQEQAGAIFRRAGVWKRARYFSNDLTSSDEIEAIRNDVGIIDVSTLGKFRLFGPDALKALQRVYISDMSRIPDGKLRYSAMLNHDGMIVDDGVVTRDGDGAYYLTASTGRAGGTIEWIRYHTRYDGWNFHMVNLTDTLAAVNLAGPRSREVLFRVTDADLSNEAFPYMGYRKISLTGDIPALALRVGFVGELSYELHFPASYGQAVWELLMEAGKEFNIRPFGLEAQFVLRLEKGHLIIGQESEQRVNLMDLGLGFLWDRKDKASKKIGAPALAFSEEQTDRFKLTGFRMDDPGRTPGDGSIVYEGEEIVGFVCTSRFSKTLEQSIGMAVVRDDLVKEGGRLHIFQYDANNPIRYTATVAPTPFYDREGLRLRS
ncbi:MAG: 2Fe-2S iron-sulfur cluster-binding protein [Desulfatiglandaceae bacterium]